MFFSSQALYCITWDLKIAGRNDFQKDVQHWIDLIQSRHPEACIVIAVINNSLWDQKKVSERILTNHTLRLEFANQQLEPMRGFVDTGDDSTTNTTNFKLQQIIKKEKQKGQVPTYIFNCTVNENSGDLLLKLVLEISTLTHMLPFKFVNIGVPTYYLTVKMKIIELRTRMNIISVSELHKLAQNLQFEFTEDAVRFLASIGEVCYSILFDNMVSLTFCCNLIRFCGFPWIKESMIFGKIQMSPRND